MKLSYDVGYNFVEGTEKNPEYSATVIIRNLEIEPKEVACFAYDGDDFEICLHPKQVGVTIAESNTNLFLAVGSTKDSYKFETSQINKKKLDFLLDTDWKPNQEDIEACNNLIKEIEHKSNAGLRVWQFLAKETVCGKTTFRSLICFQQVAVNAHVFEPIFNILEGNCPKFDTPKYSMFWKDFDDRTVAMKFTTNLGRMASSAMVVLDFDSEDDLDPLYFGVKSVSSQYDDFNDLDDEDVKPIRNADVRSADEYDVDDDEVDPLMMK